MKILGLNAFHGDSSAALLVNGQLTAAIEEERFNRIKHWAGLPIASAKYCLNGEVPEHIGISRDPKAHVGRKLLHAAVHPGLWTQAASRASNASRIQTVAADLLEAGVSDANTRIHFVEHHRAHLASTFFASPFEKAAVVSIDGFGDFSSVMWGAGAGNQLDIRGAVHYPHSLGLFYTAFTQLLGFPKYGDEYKMMGLAAYGEPRFAAKVRDVVSTHEAQVRLNLDYFVHHTRGVEMTWDDGEPKLGPVFSPKLEEVFGKQRPAGAALEQQHMDLAASVQLVLEENYFALLRYVHSQTGLDSLCLAGGVALNCAANGKLFEETPFKEIYIQPASHDAGTSIGAALYVWHQTLNKPRSFVMRHSYWGPEHTASEILHALENAGAEFHRCSEDELVRRTAAEIAAGKVVGWCQGRMEFGPRALGNRSILADPRRTDMKDILNSRIKLREPFRPFCPSIAAEKTGEWFDYSYPAPFMVTAYPIKREQRDRVPAITHADGTGRLQTVEQDVNPLYWKLIHAFEDLTGVPILLNTSFNENEPIVNTPAQALDCFLRTRMDVLAIGPYFLLKTENERSSINRKVLADSVTA